MQIPLSLSLMDNVNIFPNLKRTAFLALWEKYRIRENWTICYHIFELYMKVQVQPSEVEINGVS